MGKLITIGVYVFFVYSSDRFEDRLHVHVRDGSGNVAKFWLEPTVELFSNNGFSSKEINKIAKLTQENKQALIIQLNSLYER